MHQYALYIIRYPSKQRLEPFYSDSSNERKSPEKTMCSELHNQRQGIYSGFEVLLSHCCSSEWFDFLYIQPCNRQPRLNSRFEVRELELSCNCSSEMTKTTPRNSSDPIMSTGQVRFPKQALKREQEIGNTPSSPPPKSINHYSPYKQSIQMDKKSVNRQHMRSLECIR